MLPWETVARAAGPDGAEWVLARRGDEWVVRVAGRALMSSRQHGSEEALAAIALARVGEERARRGRLPLPRPLTLGRRGPGRGARERRGAPTVLVGGLGLGFTLRAALDRLPEDARVVVAELVPALVEWNRGPVAPLAGRPLDDPRTRLQQGDVLARIAEAKGAFDAILLDVDNGPSAVARAANDRLYGETGVRACRDALRSGGVLAVWSAGPDERYRARLEKAGLQVEVHAVPAREATSRGTRHLVFLGVKG
ncbi:MAG TPA: hypothetical protein VFL83_16880 [Anaeromyxobacter sp.]|nr:hypothetical protein [Anaeromyxobacter sp.]